MITAAELKLDVRLPPIRTSPNRGTPRAPAPTPDTNASFASSNSSWNVSTEHRPVGSPEQRRSSLWALAETPAVDAKAVQNRGLDLETLEFVLVAMAHAGPGESTERLKELAIACGTPPALLSSEHSFEDPLPEPASPSTPEEEGSADTWHFRDSRFSADVRSDATHVLDTVPVTLHGREVLPRFDEFRRRQELAVREKVAGEGGQSGGESPESLPVSTAGADVSRRQVGETGE